MADRVEATMQDMVPELDDLRRKRIFDEAELKQIIRRRRDFEYLLLRNPSKPQDYLSYIQYEVAVECLRGRRSKALHWRKKTVSDFAPLGRMHGIFNRGLAKFKADVRLWYQHIDFCLRSGSSKVLSKVLMKAVKYHPRQVRFWLLAADRELKLGHIKAARTLLLRAIRFSPRSSKLWGEFVRLEAQVARNLNNLRRSKAASAEEAATKRVPGLPVDGEAPAAAFPAPSSGAAAVPMEETDVWGPARLIFRRSLTRLDASPQACAEFLATVARCLDEVTLSEPLSDVPGPAAAGLEQWRRDLRAAAEERRPGMATAPATFSDIPDEVAAEFWAVWWSQERAQGRGWRGIAKAVLMHAPLAAVRHCASLLGEASRLQAQGGGAPLKALETFTKSPRVARHGETALAVFEALEPHLPPDEVRQHAMALLSASAEDGDDCEKPSSGKSSSAHVRLRLVSLPLHDSEGQREILATMLREATALTADDAAQLFAIAREDEDKGKRLEALLRGLSPDASGRPLVQVFLAQAIRKGLPEFQDACDRALAIGATLWEAPRLRGELLAIVLDAQLKVLPPTASSVQRMQLRFEDLLSLLDDADPEKADWWVTYIQFVQRAAHHGCAGGLPNSSTLHWRAMRSVVDQALFTEKSQQMQLDA